LRLLLKVGQLLRLQLLQGRGVGQIH
jgi:hypothetical protein